jgi:hypothetical protein
MLKVGSRKTWSPVERGASKRRDARGLYLSMAAAVPAVQHGGALETSERRRGGGGSTVQR